MISYDPTSLALNFPLLLSTLWFIAALGTSWTLPPAKACYKSSQSCPCPGGQSVFRAGKCKKAALGVLPAQDNAPVGLVSPWPFLTFSPCLAPSSLANGTSQGKATCREAELW